jgi:drug/metabolite transporter (DMT)-like permease
MRHSHAVRVWVALAVVYVVWGSTYLAIKLAVRTLPPLLTAGTRFVVAGALLGGALLLLRHPMRAQRREALAAAGVGVALLSLGVGLVHVAETRIDSSVAAMIAGSVPLQVVLWRTLAGETVRAATAGAAGIGLVGLGLVVLPEGLSGGATAVGLLIMVTASLCWSRGSFAGGRLPLPRDPLVSTTIQMLAGGAVLVVAATVAGEWSELSPDDLEPGPVAAWAYLVVAGSLVGFTAYAWLLRNAPISRVVTHQYVNPLVAVLLGALVLEERPHPAALAGAAVIVGAVVVTLRSERGAATPAPGDGARRGTRAGPTA